MFGLGAFNGSELNGVAVNDGVFVIDVGAPATITMSSAANSVRQIFPLVSSILALAPSAASTRIVPATASAALHISAIILARLQVLAAGSSTIALTASLHLLYAHLRPAATQITVARDDNTIIVRPSGGRSDT